MSASSAHGGRPGPKPRSTLKAREVTEPTKEQLEDIPETDLTKMKIIGRGLFKDRRLPLRALREALGTTQVALAAQANMRQGDVSRLEQREDVRLSTLRRYVEALGGAVQIVAVMPTGHRIVLDM